MNREKSIKIAEETVKVMEQRFYINKNGEEISIKEDLDNAISNTTLYRPNHQFNLNLQPKYNTNIEVTSETTIQAAMRLSKNFEKVCCLNFASGKNPGGGFLRGSTTQEESLVKASGLYATILQMKEMYDYNKRLDNGLYSDYMIFSPDVPVFRDKNENFINRPFKASFITAPAPNLNYIKDKDLSKVESVMIKRLEKILSVAAINNQEALVLGAFGCGVFKNDPANVAKYFNDLLNNKFKNVFKQVTFAIYDKSGTGETYKAFERQIKR